MHSTCRPQILGLGFWMHAAAVCMCVCACAHDRNRCMLVSWAPNSNPPSPSRPPCLAVPHHAGFCTVAAGSRHYGGGFTTGGSGIDTLDNNILSYGAAVPNDATCAAVCAADPLCVKYVYHSVTTSCYR